MPAPENLNTQTPGEQLKSDETTTNTSQTQPLAKPAEPAKPAFTIKHNGGGRWIVINADGDKVGDFVGDKPTAESEALRLLAGGEPYTAVTAPAKPQPQPQEEKPATKASGSIDPTTLKQPVMTEHGWLCPELSVKG